MRHLVCSFILVGLVVGVAAGEESHNVVSGVVQKIDAAAKTVAVKTEDGTEIVVRETEKTVKHGAEAVKEGGHAVVYYTGRGADATARAVKYTGEKALHVAEGTVTKVDHAAKTVAIKTKDGAETVYHLAEDGVIRAGKGIAAGAKVSVHYTEEAGKKIAHAFHLH